MPETKIRVSYSVPTTCRSLKIRSHVVLFTQKLAGLKTSVVSVNTFSTILFSACAAFAFGTIDVYRLRTDQISQFHYDVPTVTPVWSAWGNHSSFDTACVRYIEEVSKYDGTVRITARAASSTTTLYCYFHFKYDRKAPTTTSLDIPIDGFLVSIAPDSLGASQPGVMREYQHAAIILSDEQGNIVFRAFHKDWYAGYYYGNRCGKVTVIDTLNKVAEIAIPWISFAKTVPAPGVRRALDLRYYASGLPLQPWTLQDQQFNPGDTDASPERIFIGEFVIDPSFNDSIVVFTSPGPKDVWTGGIIRTITWGSTFPGCVISIDYSLDKGAAWHALEEVTLNDGAHPWRVPLVSSNGCLLRITGVHPKVAYDTTGLFSIAYAVPALTHLPDTLAVDRPLYEWSGVNGASGYRIVVATESNFKNIVIDDTIYGNVKYIPGRPLQPGLYYWKVSSNLDFNLFSPADSFRIVLPAGTVGHQTPATSRNAISIGRPSRNGIPYTLKTAGIIRIEIVDLAGRVLHSENTFKQPGTHALRFDSGRSSSGKGIYFARFGFGNRSETVTFIMVR